MTLQRLENEEFLDWKYRLIEAKLTGEIKDEWIEIVDALGLGIHYDTLRKGSIFFLEMKDYYEAKLHEGLSDEQLDKLALTKLELQLERKKMSAEKNEINKWLNQRAKTENIYEKVSQAIEQLAPIDIPEIRLANKENTIKSAVIDIADAHYGREGTILGLQGEVLAEYSIDIFEKRMWTLLEKTIEIVKKENLHFVTVLNLSDSLDGLIRMSQLQFLQLGVIDSTMRFSEFMANWLNKLSEYVTIDYRAVLGNHTEARMSSAKRGELEGENMEKIINWYIKERLKNNKNVTVHEAQNAILFDVLGCNILATHGTNEKNLENSVKDYAMIYQQPIHMLKVGHLHHGHSKTIGMAGLQNIEFVQSPSIAGIDEYSMMLKKTANAGSLITIFEADYGKSCTYDIRLK